MPWGSMRRATTRTARAAWGVKTIYLDGEDGRTLGRKVPWRGTGGDLFMQLQFPLHSGRIAGIPGRIVISVMGLAVALLSFTGIVIWLKKRAVRMKARLSRAASPADSLQQVRQ
jgi:uncharacterized iron-regulated membrane protein